MSSRRGNVLVSSRRIVTTMTECIVEKSGTPRANNAGSPEFLEGNKQQKIAGVRVFHPSHHPTFSAALLSIPSATRTLLPAGPLLFTIFLNKLC